MTSTSIRTELRKYSALACALVITLIVAVGLFVQFLRMDQISAERDLSLSVTQAAEMSEMRIGLAIDRFEMIGRAYLHLGVSRAQLLNLVKALRVAEALVSLCAREGDAEVVLVAPGSATDSALAGCSAERSPAQTLSPLSDDDSHGMALRIVSSPVDGETLLEFRMIDNGARELRATVRPMSLLDVAASAGATSGLESESVCLSLLVDDAFEELVCRNASDTLTGSGFATSPDLDLNRLTEVVNIAGLSWGVSVAADPRLLVGAITPLPFAMFGAALAIGAAACVFAYVAVDKNLLLEARAVELRMRLKQLEQLKMQNGMLDQFAAMASHDLQAPLRFIVSNAHLLAAELEELDQPELMEMVTTQIEQGERMRALVVDLLEFCRAGDSKLTIAPVDIRALVDDEVRLLTVRDEYVGTRIEIGALPASLRCDAGKFAQVVRNLLGNAVKFSQGSESPEVCISASRDISREEWTFRVEDNGPGIEEAHRERIFLPFARLDANAEGTGIGLAIVKLILERHGGSIWIDSAASEGSIFCFTLPGSNLAEQSL